MKVRITEKQLQRAIFKESDKTRYKDLVFNDVKKIINFATEHYDEETLPTEEVPSFYDWIDVDYEDKDGGLEVGFEGTIQKWRDMDRDTKQRYVDKENKQFMGTDLKYPVVLIKGDDGTLVAIDGNHRIKKSKILNKQNLKAYVVPEKDLKKYYKEINSDRYDYPLGSQ